MTRGDCYRSGPLLGCDPEEWAASGISHLESSDVEWCRTTTLSASPVAPEQVLVLPIAGQREASRAELAAFMLDGKLQGLEGITAATVQPCCLAEPRLCIKLDVARCSVGLEQASARVTALAAASESLAGASFNLSISLGRLGSGRCKDPSVPCLPVPYDQRQAEQYDLDGPRYVREVAPTVAAGERECQDDGDCVRRGCGNWCMSWLEPSMVGTCEGIAALEASFCGCVMGKCRWFEQ